MLAKGAKVNPVCAWCEEEGRRLGSAVVAVDALQVRDGKVRVLRSHGICAYHLRKLGEEARGWREFEQYSLACEGETVYVVE